MVIKILIALSPLIYWGVSMLILIYLSKFLQRRKWNEGIHRKCNGKWIYNFTDSQGNHCYYCEKCKKPTDFGWLFKIKKE
jgi:hypothetical protein